MEDLTSCMNFLQTGLMSLERVALNIITCFSWGVARKISCTSRRMSAKDVKVKSDTAEVYRKLTKLLEHLVALVQDKVLQVLQRKLL